MSQKTYDRLNAMNLITFLVGVVVGGFITAGFFVGVVLK